MALKLGSFFDSFDEWVKLGMIIHYETNGSDEGLELFDKLSQTFDKYDEVQAVSKQYYTCKYTKSNAIKIGSLYKWFYDAFPEEKMTSFLTKNNFSLVVIYSLFLVKKLVIFSSGKAS